MAAAPVYTVKKFSQMNTRNGVAYTCELVKDGSKVADVEQRGNGGNTAFWYTNQAEKDAFLARATKETGQTFEPDGAYIERLISVLEYSRMQSPPFVFGDTDPWMGEVQKFRGRVTFEQAKETLATRYAHQKPRLFDKTIGEFVPVI